MTQYRRKPLLVEAFQLPYVDDTVPVPKWLVDAAVHKVIIPVDANKTGAVKVNVRGSIALAYPGWWLVKTQDGEIFPLKDPDFQKNYEAIDAAP